MSLTPQEKIHAAVIELLEASDIDITTLHGFKVRAYVKHNEWGVEQPGTVVYYDHREYVTKTVLDSNNDDLYIAFSKEARSE